MRDFAIVGAVDRGRVVSCSGWPYKPTGRSTSYRRDHPPLVIGGAVSSRQGVGYTTAELQVSLPSAISDAAGAMLAEGRGP